MNYPVYYNGHECSSYFPVRCVASCCDGATRCDTAWRAARRAQRVGQTFLSDILQFLLPRFAALHRNERNRRGILLIISSMRYV